jgi:hypothetical protein
MPVQVVRAKTSRRGYTYCQGTYLEALGHLLGPFLIHVEPTLRDEQISIVAPVFATPEDAKLIYTDLGTTGKLVAGNKIPTTGHRLEHERCHGGEDAEGFTNNGLEVRQASGLGVADDGSSRGSGGVVELGHEFGIHALVRKYVQ